MNTFSQTDSTSNSPIKQSGRQIRKTLARNQILQLKECTLLVRLHFNQKSIDALQRSGHEKKALKYANRITAQNLKIVKAFQNYFHFCPVLFFPSQQSQYLLDDQFERITLLDSSLQHNKLTLPPKLKYFIGEFHYTEQGTAKYFSNYSAVHHESFKYEREKVYYGTMERGLYSVIIKDEQFRQLAKPFPYYVKIYRKFLFHIKRSPDKVVRKMNMRLNHFFRMEFPSYQQVHKS